MTFEKLGHTLRKARLRKKWRPRDISRRTRIQIDYIKNMEDGNFTFLPEPVIRGFIKAYARDTSLDQEEMIKNFEVAKLSSEAQRSEQAETQDKLNTEDIIQKSVDSPAGEKKSKTVTHEQDTAEIIEEISLFQQSGTNRNKESQQSIAKENDKSNLLLSSKKKKEGGFDTHKKTKSWFSTYKSEIILFLLLAVIVISIIFVYMKFGTDDLNSSEEPVKKISIFEAQKDNEVKMENHRKEIQQIRAQQKPSLRILAVASTWVRIIVDEIDTTDYTFNPGIERSFEAENKIEMKMGRADGLILWVNQDSIGVLGSAREIVDRLIITSEGIENKIVRPPQIINKPTIIDTTTNS